MKSVVIKVAPLVPGPDPTKKGGHHPVRLHFNDGGNDWLNTPLAESSIPEDWSVPAPPLDPLLNTPLDGEQLRKVFLETTMPSPRFEAIGLYLYKLLFQGDVAREWGRLRALYPGEYPGISEGLRTLLDITPSLRLLPWELLNRPPQPNRPSPPLFFDSANPVSRGTLDVPTPGLKFTWPIHALIVVGSAANDPAVKADDEIRAIELAFIKSKQPIDWEVHRRPTKQALSDEIAKFKPQIFHFIGHGRTVTGYPVLELSDKDGRAAPEEWTVTDINIDLLPWRPRLAFINACRTSDEQGQENSLTLAAAFAASGVPAVIGMQADVQGEAAAKFSGKLYESLGEGKPLDQAVAAARAEVKNLDAVTARGRDWSLPTLHLSCLPEQVLVMEPDIDPPRNRAFEIDIKLKDILDFVDRKSLRRSIWYGVDPTPYHDESRTMLVVSGGKKAGKTALIQASLKMCALRRRYVTYVDIGYNTTMNFLGVLNAIRKGDPASGSLICPPLPDAAMADFDAKYGDLLTRPGADTEVAGDDLLLNALFDSFKQGLARAAAAEPLIIALDHLNINQTHATEFLVPKLLLPVARNEVPGVRMILVGTPTEVSNLMTPTLMGNARLIEVPLWPSDEFEPLAKEICLYNGLSLDDEDVQKVISGTAARTKTDWGPAKLRTLLDLIK